MPGDQGTLGRLELPRTDLRSIPRSFGPGLILMMTGIGTSHLIKLSDSPAEVRRSQLLGEHTHEVLETLLGMTAAEAEAVRRNGAV